MAYGRRYIRRYYSRANRDKYSVERTVFNTVFTTTGATTQLATVVASTNLQGMRKVKHVDIDLIASGYYPSGGNAVQSAGPRAFGYVLYYKPAGVTVDAPNWTQTTGDLMATNQYIISAGTWVSDNQPVRIRSPLARNLNSGDSIQLAITVLDRDVNTPNNEQPVRVTGFVKYAITLQ